MKYVASLIFLFNVCACCTSEKYSKGSKEDNIDTAKTVKYYIDGQEYQGKGRYNNDDTNKLKKVTSDIK